MSFASLRAAAAAPRANVRILDLSRSTELQCVNLMCEHVGERCACRLALWFCRHQLPALEVLSLRRNDLRFVPEPILDLRQLRVLDVAHNKLDALPETITRLDRLEELSVEGNAAMAALPSALFELPTLRSLTVWSDDDDEASLARQRDHADILATSVPAAWQFHTEKDDQGITRGVWRR